jgi:hypothetical protein
MAPYTWNVARPESRLNPVGDTPTIMRQSRVLRHPRDYSAACFQLLAWVFGFALRRKSVSSWRSRTLLRKI